MPAMHRFYLPPEECKRNVLALEGREAHHASHVLRLHRGDRVTVLDGAGREFLCEAAEVTGKAVLVAVRDQRTIPPLPYQITLLQALPKGKLFESIIQKATELGVYRIVPLLSERVVLHFDEESSEHKLEKWRLAAIEAIKQCGSAWLPRIEAPSSVQRFLARPEKIELSLLASLQPDSGHPREFFSRFMGAHKRLPQTLAVWIGPEGDFTPDEMAAIRSAGAQAITLGPLVLRTETAAIYCLSILNYELRAKHRA